MDEERGCSEVAALDSQRRTAGGKRQLLHDVEVHVEDPQLLLLLGGHEDEVGGGYVEGPHGGVPRVDVVQELNVLHLWGGNMLHDYDDE